MAAEWYTFPGGGGDYGRAGSMQRQARVQGDIDADTGFIRDLEIAGTLRIGDGGKVVDADGSEWNQDGVVLQSADADFGDAILFRRTPTATYAAKGQIGTNISGANEAALQLIGDSGASGFAAVSINGSNTLNALNAISLDAYNTAGSQIALFHLDASGNVYISISATKLLEIASGYLTLPNLPTSTPGGSGRLWNNAGVVNIT